MKTPIPHIYWSYGMWRCRVLNKTGVGYGSTQLAAYCKWLREYGPLFGY